MVARFLLAFACALSLAAGCESQTQGQDSTKDLAEARALIQAGKLDDAITKLNQMAEHLPALKGAARELGIAFYRKNDFVQAISGFKRSLEENPEDKEAVQLLGLSYYFAGRPGEAIPYLEKVQSWYPVANVDAAYVLGLCNIQEKNYDKARRAFATMYDVPPDSAAAYLFTARMLLRQEFDPIAEEHAQRAISLDPKLPLAHFFLGELYLYKSRIPESIAEFRKELALNPGHAATYYKLGDAYTRIQQFEDAERLLQRSIWLDATATGPYILMGKVLLKKGETQLAVRTLQHALSMDPNNSIAHHLLGQAYRTLGKTAEADQEFRLADQLRAGPADHP